MLTERLTQMSRPSRGAFLAALVAIAAFAMYQWVLQPHTAELAAAQRYEGLIERIAHRNESSEKLLGAKRRKLKKLEGRYDQLSACLFTSAGLKQFYSDLPKLVESSGCNVNSLNSVPTPVTGDQRRSQRQSGISSRHFKLSVSGGYAQTLEMMGRLSDYEPQVYVDSVRIDLLAGGRLRCDIDTTIYVTGDREAQINE